MKPSWFTLGILEASWADRGPSWGHLRGILGHLGGISGAFGGSWGGLGGLLEPSLKHVSLCSKIFQKP